MTPPPGLKAALKRGALVTAANWPLVAVQFVADSTFKILLAVPVIGGVLLVALLLDADVEVLLSGSASEVAWAVGGALRGNPTALTAFLSALAVVLLGGSALTSIVKAGTVSVLAAAEAGAGPLERPPLRLHLIQRANRTSIESFLEGCRRFWGRYLGLGALLLVVYSLTGALYLGFFIEGYALADSVGMLLWWTVAMVAASSAVLVWISLVNLLYLLTQMVVTVEDVGIRSGVRKVFQFLRAMLREVAGIFGVVLVLVLLAFTASILAGAGLGLISFVPIVGLAVLPLQLAAWLVRGFVFQYLALTALGAYLTQYRHHTRGGSIAAVPGQRLA